MCQKVIINRGEKEIETPQEFEQYFGFLPNGYESEDFECCLCNCDLDATFKEKRIEYGTCAMGDYYVGELDKCELEYRFTPKRYYDTQLLIDDATRERVRDSMGKMGKMFRSMEVVTERSATIMQEASKGMDKMWLLMQRSRELGAMSKRKKRRNRHKKKNKEFVFAYKYASLSPTEEEVIHKMIPIVKRELL